MADHTLLIIVRIEVIRSVSIHARNLALAFVIIELRRSYRRNCRNRLRLRRLRKWSLILRLILRRECFLRLRLKREGELFHHLRSSIKSGIRRRIKDRLLRLRLRWRKREGRLFHHLRSSIRRRIKDRLLSLWLRLSLRREGRFLCHLRSSVRKRRGE